MSKVNSETCGLETNTVVATFDMKDMSEQPGDVLHHLRAAIGFQHRLLHWCQEQFPKTTKKKLERMCSNAKIHQRWFFTMHCRTCFLDIGNNLNHATRNSIIFHQQKWKYASKFQLKLPTRKINWAPVLFLVCIRHILAQKYLVELLMWSASYVQKNTSVKPDSSHYSFRCFSFPSIVKGDFSQPLETIK